MCSRKFCANITSDSCSHLQPGSKVLIRPHNLQSFAIQSHRISKEPPSSDRGAVAWSPCFQSLFFCWLTLKMDGFFMMFLVIGFIGDLNGKPWFVR